MPQNRGQYRVVAARIARQVAATSGKGLKACLVFLTGRIKETLSTPAPRKRVTDRHGNFYYRATAPATQGAPPRKLSSRMRSSTTWAMMSPVRGLVGLKARSPRGYNYPKRLEKHTSHKYLVPTVKRYRTELRRIMGRNLRFRGV